MAKDPYKYFRIEARELLQQLGQGALDLEKGAAAGELVPRLLRLAHTLKGAARVVRQPEIADGAHRIEDVLAPIRDAGAAVSRADIETVLAHLDRISAQVVALPGPADDPGLPRASFDEAPRSLRADVVEMDALLQGVAQSHARVALLRRSCGHAATARALAQRLQTQLLPRRGRGVERSGDDADAGPVQALAQELRLAVEGLERDLTASTEQVDSELRQLRDSAEQLRLVAAATLFTTLERSARDVAQTLGKRVLFEGHGGDVRLDASMLGAVQGALLQLVRNAVAHGIETPAERLAAGKSADGHVTVEVLRRGRQVAFRCLDDGAGIDLEAVRRSAQRMGLIDASAAPPGADALLQLLLRGGLSTALAVTEVAGRGVGLDVVRETARRLGGEMRVQTTAGQGTTLEMLVPLSLASIEALLVESAGNVVAIPLDALRGTLRLAAPDIARSAQGDSLVHEGRVIPYVALSSMLDGAATDGAPRRFSALVVEHGGVVAAFGVDRLRTVATIVLRPLPDFAPASALVAGVALNVEGIPQLVLDAEALVLAAQRAGGAAAQAAKAPIPVLVIDDSLTTRMLEQSILESAGYEVHLAASGEEGLELARRQPCALFLVDVEMPGMDGFTFIERIRADPALRNVPAMLVTSRASPGDRQRGLQVGAQAYIVKSEFAQSEFLERVRQLTREAR